MLVSLLCHHAPNLTVSTAQPKPTCQCWFYPFQIQIWIIRISHWNGINVINFRTCISQHVRGSRDLCFFSETIFCKLKRVNAMVIYDAKLILWALVFILITAMICGHKLNAFCESMKVENFWALIASRAHRMYACKCRYWNKN